MANIKDALHILVSRKKVATAGEATPTSDGGGLLTGSSVETVERSTAEAPDEGWVEIKRENSVVVAANPYHKRRKTQFGKTIRNNRNRLQQKSRDLPDLYTLHYEGGDRLIEAPNNSVRLLLSLR